MGSLKHYGEKKELQSGQALPQLCCVTFIGYVTLVFPKISLFSYKIELESPALWVVIIILNEF